MDPPVKTARLSAAHAGRAHAVLIECLLVHKAVYFAFARVKALHELVQIRGVAGVVSPKHGIGDMVSQLNQP
jgi:hypothetical protein